MSYNLQSLINIMEHIMHSEHTICPTTKSKFESLVKIIERILHPHHKKKPEIESLHEKAQALKQLLENPSQLTGDKIQSLEGRIRDAAYEAEDILESHLVKQICLPNRRCGSTFSPRSLKKVIKEFDSAEKEIKKMMDGSHIPDSSSLPAAAASSSKIDPNPKKILVGLSEDSIQLKDRLTRQEAKLAIIPIVGMGGIGKTTLARNVYDDRLIVSHFDTRAWVTISQEYDVRVIVLGLLECIIGKLADEMHQNQNDQLAVHLHKSLCGRRYLIVLDDMWDDKAWDDIKMFFPDNNNGSRVMMTTRECSVANYAGSNSSHHQMHLLNEGDSWNLLREKVFAQETCPSELETIGIRISNNCGGLPLAIHVISGVLSQVKRTQEYWVQVAKNVASVVANNDEQFSRILSLSYDHLPNHLKPCFLYMSAFPEDCEIGPSSLIKLWVAEGFVEPVSDKSLEETAMIYLKSLVDRNLIFVRRQETNRIVKSYGMHDLLRELCVRKASEEKFLHNLNRQVSHCPRDALSLRRVSVDSPDLIEDVYNAMRLARSLLCIPRSWPVETTTDLIFRLQLLRVLDIARLVFESFPEELLQLVNLRYLAIRSHSFLPPSISLLCNLQTIILHVLQDYGSSEGIDKLFRDMPHLRHFQSSIPVSYNPRDALLKENLQTLSGIKVDDVDGFGRMIETVPNLKKLGIFCYISTSSNIGNVDLTCLSKLETLKLRTRSWSYMPFLSFLIFPPSLKKLTLEGCEIPDGFMNKVGTLTNLEVLKLSVCYWENSTWEPSEGEFSSLKFLLLEECRYLVKWEADETHFPRLECLVIQGCLNLEEIPSGIGEIPTLERIQVTYSSSGVEASARKIAEEQLELGNDGLQVLIVEYKFGM